jgi:hypothetical protein
MSLAVIFIAVAVAAVVVNVAAHYIQSFIIISAIILRQVIRFAAEKVVGSVEEEGAQQVIIILC